MPKQLNSGQITQALQRAFGFKGRYIPMLDEVIVPVYVIADPSPASQTRLCAATAGAGPSIALEVSGVQLFNPLGSGNVVNVTNVTASSDIKQQHDITFFDGDLPITSNIHFRDRRNRGTPSTQIRASASLLPFLGDTVAVIEVDGALAQTASWETQAGDPRQPLAVLDEGQGLLVQERDDALTGLIRVNFRFLEIPKSETNPAGGLP